MPILTGAEFSYPGNQGSVKVDGDDIDDGPANHPHVICGLLVAVEHGFGAPFDIDFLAQAPTTQAGDDQRLLIVHVPNGNNVSGLIDLRAFVGGIVPNVIVPSGFAVVTTAGLAALTVTCSAAPPWSLAAPLLLSPL